MKRGDSIAPGGERRLPRLGERGDSAAPGGERSLYCTVKRGGSIAPGGERVSAARRTRRRVSAQQFRRTPTAGDEWV